MRRRLFPVVLALVLLLVSVTPALAIKGGTPDAGEHPWVAGIVFFTPEGDLFLFCSGTLIAPDVLLTAAHCAEAEGPALVYFDEGDLRAIPEFPFGGGDSHLGTAVAYDLWNGGELPNTGDVGVVLLDEPIDVVARGWTLPSLAPVGALDTLATQRGKQDVSLKLLGYGQQAQKPRPEWEVSRLKGFVKVVNLRNFLTDGYNVRTSNSGGNGTGGGGICFGDSGGPV
ncbi:MAG: trypsin-like serine protease, partial [Caldilineaceae bacterium]